MPKPIDMAGVAITVDNPLLYAPALILAIAATIDFLLGDPWTWLHPVQVIGWFIHYYVHAVMRVVKTPWKLKLAGIALGLIIVIGSGTAGWVLVMLTQRIHPIIGILTASILLASCFAGRSLRNAADDVLSPLLSGDLDIARSKLSLYVGRDTKQLDSTDIYRAVFETVTENATDGVTAPLFYSLVGAMLPMGSVPLAIAYKAASTLDSMVGYRTPPYTDLGYFSAKLDDCLTWIPCRLTVLTIGLLSGKPGQVWSICRRDAPHDPSPNAGWSECVYAAALNVQVGGSNTYQGVVKHKPKLGNSIEPLTAQKVVDALHLTRWVFLLWLGMGVALTISHQLLA